MYYDYYSAVEDDIYDYIQENIDELKEEYNSLSEAEDDLNDTLFIEDSVTGNASGSYTFNSDEAKEYVEANIDLGIEAYESFGLTKGDFYEDCIEHPEKADVTIRCYCLSSAIDKICRNYDFDDFGEEIENEPSIKM